MRCFFILLLVFSSMPVFAQRTVITHRPYDYWGYHSPYYNNFYAQERRFKEPYYTDNYSRNYYNGGARPSVLGNIKQYFKGQLTGLTPSIDDVFVQDNYPPSYYGNRRYEGYSSPLNSGYRANNYDTGSYSGVRILD